VPPQGAADSDAPPVLAIVRAHWRAGAVGAIVCALVVATILLLLPRTYTATASFAPEAQSGGADLARVGGLAAQFGFAVPGAAATQSPDFYAQILASTPLLDSTARTPYAFVRDGRRTSEDLVEVFHSPGDTPGQRLAAAEKRLRGAVSIGVLAKTGTVTFTVKTRWPDLSAEVAARMLALLNKFNIESRQERAGDERRFTEARLAQTTAELRASEDRLRDFLEANRVVARSPGLQLQSERLQADVELHRTLVQSLSQAYEQSRIEEVRNTPLLTVVQAPAPPPLPDPRGLAFKTLLALIAGMLFGTLGAHLRATLRRRKA
jgi:uncharacterized protein involved in exopolysaccharide biosynthesis